VCQVENLEDGGHLPRDALELQPTSLSSGDQVIAQQFEIAAVSMKDSCAASI
jgi:hypothetical protein